MFVSTCHATAYCDLLGNETRIASSTGYCGLAEADVPYTTLIKYHFMNSGNMAIILSKMKNYNLKNLCTIQNKEKSISLKYKGMHDFV